MPPNHRKPDANTPAGGEPSNTPPATLHDKPLTPTRTNGGIDTLHIAARVELPANTVEDLFNDLDNAKKAAQRDDPDPAETIIPIGDHLYAVHPTGAKSGTYYTWLLRGQDWRLALQKCQAPKKSQYNVALIAGSLACLCTGDVHRLASAAKHRLDQLGTVHDARVSRADLYCDLAGVDTATLQTAFSADRWISRARTAAEYATFREGRRMTGFRIGTDPLLRVYDKLAELTNDPIKRHAWNALAWENQPPATATRVEFQCRRETLKTLGINTLDDLPTAAAGAAAYLSRKWFRLTSHDIDRRHLDRARTHPAWTLAQDALATHLGRSPPTARHWAKQDTPTDTFWRQIRGCAESAAAISDVYIADPTDLAGWTREQLIQHLHREKPEKTVQARIRSKRAKLKTTTPPETTL